MSKVPLYTRMEKLQPKLHGLAAGMTLGMGSIFLNQGCPMMGQCPTCGACVPSLSLLVLPLLADGAILLSSKVLKRRAEEAE